MKTKRNMLTVVMMIAAIGLAAGAAAADLIAHYPLDTITAGTTPDSTGGTAGTLNGGGISLTGSGVIGDSFDFASTGNHVAIPNHPWGTTAFTASVWFNPDSLGNQGPLADWTNSGTSPQTFLFRTSGSTLQTYVRSGNVQRGGSVSFPSETLTTSDFNHVALTYDGQRARTYLNGELSTTVHDFGSASTIGNGTAAGDASIGRSGGGSEREMVGRVDDVAFWGETLTDGKVAAIFHLADEPPLNYDASQASQLFQVFDGSVPKAVIGGKTWSQDTGHGGAAGDVVDLGGGDFFLNLDGTAGVSTLTGPPPTFVTVAEFDVNSGSSPTQAGYLGLVSTGTGTQNGVTLTSSAGLDEWRDRGGSGVLVGHSFADLLRDFGFENDGSNPKTVTFDLTGLTPETEHEITIFSYDRTANNGVTSDWYQDAIAGSPLFTQTNVSADPDSGDFTLRLFSEADGAIRIVGASNALVLFNGISVAELESPEVPEPATLALLGLAACGLGGYVRRRRKA